MIMSPGLFLLTPFYFLFIYFKGLSLLSRNSLVGYAIFIILSFIFGRCLQYYVDYVKKRNHFYYFKIIPMQFNYLFMLDCIAFVASFYLVIYFK